MPTAEDLSLREWAVLGLVAEGRTHGFEVSRAFGRGGPMGKIWTIPRPLVYRAIASLQSAGLVGAIGASPGERGPERRLVEATPEGRAALQGWLVKPVAHVRNARSELLVKLALHDRAGTDPVELLGAQSAQLDPLLAGLREKLAEAEGFDATLARWRLSSAEVLATFVAGLIADRRRHAGPGIGRDNAPGRGER
jgi:PadR family transcriptional regulator AphA